MASYYINPNNDSEDPPPPPPPPQQPRVTLDDRDRSGGNAGDNTPSMVDTTTIPDEKEEIVTILQGDAFYNLSSDVTPRTKTATFFSRKALAPLSSESYERLQNKFQVPSSSKLDTLEVFVCASACPIKTLVANIRAVAMKPTNIKNVTLVLPYGFQCSDEHEWEELTHCIQTNLCNLYSLTWFATNKNNYEVTTDVDDDGDGRVIFSRSLGTKAMNLEQLALYHLESKEIKAFCGALPTSSRLNNIDILIGDPSCLGGDLEIYGKAVAQMLQSSPNLEYFRLGPYSAAESVEKESSIEKEFSLPILEALQFNSRLKAVSFLERCVPQEIRKEALATIPAKVFTLKYFETSRCIDEPDHELLGAVNSWQVLRTTRMASSSRRL
jgi:hypothetical protein